MRVTAKSNCLEWVKVILLCTVSYLSLVNGHTWTYNDYPENEKWSRNNFFIHQHLPLGAQSPPLWPCLQTRCSYPCSSIGYSLLACCTYGYETAHRSPCREATGSRYRLVWGRGFLSCLEIIIDINIHTISGLTQPSISNWRVLSQNALSAIFEIFKVRAPSYNTK